MLNKKAETSCRMLYDHFEFANRKYEGRLDSYEMWVLCRFFYDMVFQNKSEDTGLSSMSATTSSVKKCKDHFTTPQFVARVVMDNWSDFKGESGREFFKTLFAFCMKTVKVTPEENKSLSGYTVNNLKDNDFYLRKGCLERYVEEFDKLYLKGFGYVPTTELAKVLNYPEYLLEKEKNYFR